MKVQLHESWEDVARLSVDWNTVLAASSNSSIFLTWEWIQAWWKNYGLGRPLFVLSAWEGDSLEGLAPFFVDRIPRWGSEWACLKLIGDGSRDSDYLDCIATRGRENDVIAAFVQFLESHTNCWQYLELHGTPEHSPCLAALLNCAGNRFWKFSLEKIPCATLALPRDWEHYLQLLKPRFRTKVRSTLAFFEEKICATPLRCNQEEQLEQWLQTLFDLHTRRWETRNKPGVFQDASKQQFYQDVSRAALRQGWLSFHRLDWGERPLAMQYGFNFQNRFYLLQEGYDPDFATLRPGMALRCWLLRNWIEAGLSEYDFLAGNAPHKLEWGAQVKWSVRLTLAPSAKAAWVAFGAARTRDVAKDAVRRVIPEHILGWRRKRIPRNGHDLPNRQAGLAPLHFVRTADQKNSPGQRIIAALYASTPVGAVGRAFASRYEVHPKRQQLRRRTVPICHIFIYHRVNDEFDPFLPAVPVNAFRKQMQFLKRNFPILSLNDFANGSVPDRGEKYQIAITFDDGYRDNFLCAFPVLKELDLPATIFLTTGCLESGDLPWYDKISWAFKLTTQSWLSLGHLGGPEVALKIFSERLTALGRTLAWLRALSQDVRLRCMPEVIRALRVPTRLSVPNPMLSWQEVRQMSKCNVAFGAHTVSHPVLARLRGDQLEAEINDSKNKIEEKLQLPVRHFAYPFGQPSDIGPEVKQAVKRAGFSTAATTVWGFNRPGDDMYDLKRFSPRFSPWDYDPGRFAMMLDWYRLTGLEHRNGQTLAPETSELR